MSASALREFRWRERENVQMSKCKLQVQYFSVLFPFLLWLWLCASSPHVHLCFYATLCQHRTELWNSQQRRVVDTAPLHFVGTLLHHLHQCHPLLDPLLWHSLDPMVRSFFFHEGALCVCGLGWPENYSYSKMKSPQLNLNDFIATKLRQRYKN